MRRLGERFERLETRTPPASLLGALADVFGQSEDDLFAGHPPTDSIGDLDRYSSDQQAEHARPSIVSPVKDESITKDDDVVDVTSETGSKMPAITAAAAKAVHGEVDPILDLRGLGITGSSSLVRTGSGFSGQIHAEGLPPGAYTFWGVSFDDPGSCTPRPLTEAPPVCGGDDFAGGTGGASGELLDGKVVGPNGKATFAGHRNEDPDGFVPKPNGELVPALQDSLAAEVHLVIRGHGEKIPGLVHEQISTLNGGCEAGQPNVGQCTNVAGAIYLPVV